MNFNLTAISAVILGLVAAVAGILAIPAHKARPALITTFAVLLLAAAVTGIFGSISATSQKPPTPKQAQAAEPPSNATTSESPNSLPSGYVEIPLSVSSGMQATAYFGQLASIVSSLRGAVKFNLNDVYNTDPQRCSLTVVFTNVPGGTGAVYAEGLRSGWGAAELSPSQTVANPDQSLHQQIVTPPVEVSAGTTWSASALVSSGAVRTSSGGYDLDLRAVTGSTMTWAIDGNEVTCST